MSSQFVEGPTLCRAVGKRYTRIAATSDVRMASADYVPGRMGRKSINIDEESE
jgi:hypothetical protein